MATLAGIVRPLSAHLEGSRDGRLAFQGSASRLLLAGLVWLTACGPRPGPAGGLTLIDDAGDTTRVPARFTRVVSLAPATTELIFALGAGDRLVGRTRWCLYPEQARQVPDLGDGLQPNLEAVLGVRPDFVVLYRSSSNAESARRLRAAGVAAIQLQMDRLSDVPRLARLLGPPLGRGAAADSLAYAFERALATAQAPESGSATQLRLLLLAWDAPPIAIGGASFQSEMLALAGGRNLFEDLDRPSAEVSLEAIVARDPDAVLVTGDRIPDAFDRPEWQAVRAIRERRFVRFTHPGFDRPSPRAPEVVAALRRQLEEARP